MFVFTFSGDCYGYTCPSGSTTCKRLITTSDESGKLLTKVTCHDRKGKFCANLRFNEFLNDIQLMAFNFIVIIFRRLFTY